MTRGCMPKELCCYSREAQKQQLQRIIQVDQTPWKFLGILYDFSNPTVVKSNLVRNMSDGEIPTHVATLLEVAPLLMQRCFKRMPQVQLWEQLRPRWFGGARNHAFRKQCVQDVLNNTLSAVRGDWQKWVFALPSGYHENSTTDLQLSWLEHQTHNLGVLGSSPNWSTSVKTMVIKLF